MSAHDRYLDLVSAYAFGHADEAERALFEAHLDAGCDECSQELAAFEELAAEIEYAQDPVAPAPSRRESILSMVRNEAATERQPPPTATAPVTSTPLVGREQETKKILERLDALAKRAEGATFAIEGEGGVGKSRLVEELIRRAGDEELIVLAGSSGGMESDLAYQPFAEALRAWLDVESDTDPSEIRRVLASRLDDASTTKDNRPSDLLAPSIARVLGLPADDTADLALAGIEGEALERLIQKAIHEFLTLVAARRPVVFVLDDIHQADPSSLNLLESIAPLVESKALLLVPVSRPGYPETAGRIRTHLQTGHALRFHSLDLKPLGEAETRALIRELLSATEFPGVVAEHVLATCEGNPFFIEQSVRALIEGDQLRIENGRAELTRPLATEGLAHGVQEVVLQRVATLGPQARRVLELAAIAGRSIHKRALVKFAAATNADIDTANALRELCERDLLVLRRNRDTAQAKVVTLTAEEIYSFKHVILRDAVYGSIPEARRTELHLQCADVLEQVFASRRHDFQAALAVHYARGGDLEHATVALLEAGRHAAASAASEEALRLFREAHRTYRMAYGDGGPAQIEAQLEGDLARALLSTGRLDESVEHFNTALRKRGHWVPESQAGLYAKFAWDAPNVLLRALTGRLNGSGRAVSDEVRDSYSLMYSRCRAQNIVDARRNFFDNFSVFHYGAKHGDPASVNHAAGFLAATGAFFAWSGLSFTVGSRFLEAAREATKTGVPVDTFLYQAMAFVYHFHHGDWGAEHDINAETLELGLRHGMLWDADVYLGMRCERDIRQGRFEQASESIVQLRELADDWGYSFARSNEYAATAYLLTEQRDLAAAIEASNTWYGARQEDTLHLMALGTRAKAEALAGDFSSAEKSLEAAGAIFRRDKQLTPYYAVSYWSGRLRLAVESLAKTTASPSDRRIAQAKKDAGQGLRAAAKIFRDRAEIQGLDARVDWMAGNRDRALGTWESALATARSAAVRPEEARLARDIGLALAETQGQTLKGTGSEAWLDQARTIMGELGAERELGELETERERRRKVA